MNLSTLPESDNQQKSFLRRGFEWLIVGSLFFGVGDNQVNASGPQTQFDPRNLYSYLNNPVEAPFGNYLHDGYEEWMEHGGDGTLYRYIEWAMQVNKTDKEIQAGVARAQKRFATSDEWLLYHSATLVMPLEEKHAFDHIPDRDSESGILEELGIQTTTVTTRSLDSDGNFVYQRITFAMGSDQDKDS